MSGSGPLLAAGLCTACRHAVVVASSRSRFLRCRRAEQDSRYPKYPTLPVDRCPGYERSGMRRDEGRGSDAGG